MRRSKGKVVDGLVIPTMLDAAQELGSVDLGPRAFHGERDLAIIVQSGEIGWNANDWKSAGILVGKIKVPKNTRYLRFFFEFPERFKGGEHGVVEKSASGAAEEVPARRRRAHRR